MNGSGLRLLLPLTLLLVCAQAPAATAPPRMREIPNEDDSTADLFVEAWLSLRNDFDTLAHGDVHPRLLDAWLDAAPRFLLRDILRHAREPRVLIGAAMRLSRKADDSDRKLISALAQHYSAAPSSFEFSAAALVSRDPQTMKQLAAQLAGNGQGDAFSAEQIQVAAGYPEGLVAMRRHLDACDRRARTAAQMLGRYGSEKDIAFLEEPANVQCADAAISAAVGEIRMRALLPEFHIMIDRRDPSGTRHISRDGLYSTWFIIADRAFKKGVLTPDAFVKFAQSFTVSESEWPGFAPDTIDRRVAELREFAQLVNQLLKKNESLPEWPADYPAAREEIANTRSRAKNESAAFTRRVSAAISLLFWLPPAQKHEAIDELSDGARVLTPLAERTVDHNLASCVVVSRGDTLRFSFATPTKVTRVWLANTCAQSKGTSIESIAASVTTANGEKHNQSVLLLGTTRYYQPVSVSLPASTELSITVEKTSGAASACIAEIRFEVEK